ncbi:hypothetical protein Cni_G24083 [Canna indica]|uniref:Uncharacterized protein n=1 Tax=Canna indica TaxID=4628 RepID=A0AAQ3L1P4_9LILI|nr:hypothetical protein Cni_G24083 [Canna indica]
MGAGIPSLDALLRRHGSDPIGGRVPQQRLVNHGADRLVLAAGVPSLEAANLDGMLVVVAEQDLLRDRALD